MSADVVVIGGGAAGLMCALTAGRRGRRVRVIEHANRCGKKILMSGGGRCNFTNTGTTPANFLSANPHFCKSALARFRPEHFIQMVEAHGIDYHEKELGQLFCNESSKQIVTMLLDECAAAGVQIDTGRPVASVAGLAGGGFHVQAGHERIECESLVVATGGLSIPSMGATGFGYEIARQFGHSILPTRAGLVPLTLSGKHQAHYAELAGVAFPVIAHCGKARFQNALLITHRGLSGPGILQISSYWEPGKPLWLDLLPDDSTDVLLQRRKTQPASELKTALGDWLPKRFAQRLCEVWFENRPLKQIADNHLLAIGEQLKHWPITASGTEGYRTAEVTLGGVDTDGVSSSTLESRHANGLYFVGEVLDVTGWLGGYNFQWAWASGHAAGLAA